MALAVDVAAKVEETRTFLRRLWGAEKYEETMRPLVEALRKVGEKTGQRPFQVAIDMAKKAGSEGKEGAVWQFTAAACEIAEDRW